MELDKEKEFQCWDLPDLGECAIDPSAGKATGNTEKLQQQAYEEAFARGLVEGRDAGRQLIAGQSGRLEQLMCNLAQPYEDLDKRVEKELLALVFSIVRQLVGDEISEKPELIMAIVNKAVAVLPSASRDLRLHLHPEDAQLLHELLPDPDRERQWRIIEDVAVDRGGCRVVTETSQVDATVETRLNNIISALVAGECSQDAPE
jgi:flagellar assembly protein FliH